MAPSKNTKEKGVTAIMNDNKLIKKHQIFLLQEKLDIIAKVEAGEKLCDGSRFYSDNESTVRNMVKCKDAIKNAVQQALPHARDNIVKVGHVPPT
ncbi:hypothetical protein E2C01_099946 [Portunus trituberculatus]|uniref:Uncharacterized protein n=1 Tax=Portunus trituberculatus TaxID=210409 RepID=A0A5B7KC84_PORTR|nr:hypothetical protein [Portunus trituberculatus]